MLITNFNKKQLPKYRKALEIYKSQTGDKDLYIDKNAYYNGIKDDEMSALRYNGSGMLTEFWRIFDTIEEE